MSSSNTTNANANTEYVILVDSQDNKIGLEEKVKCHLPNGKLHRAFTALLFDPDGNLLLTQRSKTKMLWPHDWDGTFASHPREKETFVTSAQRRMPEELGLHQPAITMDYLFKFEYHVPYKDIGSENEICGTLIATIKRDAAINPIKEEISQTRWISPNELVQDLQKNPQIYCPWMLIALYLLDTAKPNMQKRYGTTIQSWTTPQTKNDILQAINTHLPQSQWRPIINNE